ncbi:abc transporter b family member mitochondrial [Hordeum vulgare]|nr:abc transporter b family member mitochondrial [Hordeum vulgare]
MWSSGRGSGSRSGRERDLERERRVRTDGARKRGARRWTNRGMSPPASFNLRETEEYDRRSMSFSSARSSYAGSSSSSGAGFFPVKREWSEDEEEPEELAPFAFVPVKEEPEEPAPLGRRRVVRPEDYVADFDAEELEAHQWQQAVTANVAANEKAEEWRRIRAEQVAKYIDMCSSGNED